MKAKVAGLTLFLVCGIVYGPATPAHADVSAACWEHLAGVETHTTPAADRRYHLERGEPSPCTEYDAQEGSNSNRKVDSQPKQQYNDEPKQRNRRDSPGWGCKLTWKGYRCG